MACQCAVTPERLKHFDGSCTGNDWFLLFFRILIYSLMSWSHITVLKNSKLKLKKTKKQVSYKRFFYVHLSKHVFSVYKLRRRRRLTWLFKAHHIYISVTVQKNVGGKHNYCSDSLLSPSLFCLCAVCFFIMFFFLFFFMRLLPMKPWYCVLPTIVAARCSLREKLLSLGLIWLNKG